MIFETKEYGHELVVFGSDQKSGLKAIIAIHDTTLGPALGGCRMWNYASEAEAITDVLRLSKGMTYKAALADLKLGGGKAVIIGDSKHQKTPDLFYAMGDFVHKLGGKYITAADVGTNSQDMRYIRERTPHVVGLSLEDGGSGNPSIFTALGVLKAVQASVSYKFDGDSLQGKKIIIQGLGKVGMFLCEHFHNLGAHIFAFDLHASRMQKAEEQFGATLLKEDEIFSTDADVFVPCALGAILNAQTIPRLKAKVVSGAANNQLKTASDGQLLRDHGILYAPDYVANAGGVINVSYEGPHYKKEEALKHLEVIPSTLKEIYEISDSDNIPTSQAADILAKQRIKKAS